MVKHTIRHQHRSAPICRRLLHLRSDQKDIVFSHIALKKKDGFVEKTDIDKYDAFVLYNMSENITNDQKEAFLSCLEQGKGFVVIHHAIANYPQWPIYPEIIGAGYFLKAMEWRGKNKMVQARSNSSQRIGRERCCSDY